jgi:hypothetical protein
MIRDGQYAVTQLRNPSLNCGIRHSTVGTN